MALAEEFEHARDYAAIALKYAKHAASEKNSHLYCKYVRLAAQRHLNDLKKAADGWDYYFDEWHANDICDFVEKLPHVEGVWENPHLHLEPWQIFVLACVFGWRRTDNGNRRFTYVYEELARKGAKSTKTAAVTLYTLTCEGEVGPQILIGATTGEQAGKVFNPAKRMVEKTPDLAECFGLQTFARSITCAENDGFIQPVNSKGKTQDGWNPHCVVLDELHAHADRALFDVMKSAFGARKNYMMWIITTAGYNLGGVCYEQRQTVAKVLEGALQADHIFAIIFTIDEGDDPFNSETWVKANPMIGITPTWENMKQAAIEAAAGDDAEFKTKRLNVWLNAASQWLKIEKWNACADPAIDWSSFDGLDVYIGADLADKDDLTAAVVAAWDSDDRLIWKPLFWLPDITLKEYDSEKMKGVAPYRRWIDEGFIRLTEGDWIDSEVIEQQINEWIERYSVRMITFDQFAAAQALAVKLNRERAEPIAQILHKKASNVTDPARELEKRVKAGPHRFGHDGNPVLTWMASNVVVRRGVDETILPKKEDKDSPMKIDGIDAGINAIAPAVAVDDGEPAAEPKIIVL